VHELGNPHKRFLCWIEEGIAPHLRRQPNEILPVTASHSPFGESVQIAFWEIVFPDAT
jgi:hypothetical protein